MVDYRFGATARQTVSDHSFRRSARRRDPATGFVRGRRPIPRAGWNQRCSISGMDQMHMLSQDVARRFLASENQLIDEQSQLFQELEQFAFMALETIRSWGYRN